MLDLARRLCDEGVVQLELLAIYDLFRELYASDADRICYNAVLVAMGWIVG